jgi:hypothetical protein
MANQPPIFGPRSGVHAHSDSYSEAPDTCGLNLLSTIDNMDPELKVSAELSSRSQVPLQRFLNDEEKPFAHGHRMLEAVGGPLSYQYCDASTDEGIGALIKDGLSPQISYFQVNQDASSHELTDRDSNDTIFSAEGLDIEYSPRKSSKSRKRASSTTKTSPPSKCSRFSKTRVPQDTSGQFSCNFCNHTPFKNALACQRHTFSHTRPFICVFAFAGCSSSFSSKNEWKRHVSSQHLNLTTWVCDLQACSKILSGQPVIRGIEFNRRDLFIQHLRTMHEPLRDFWRTGRGVEWEEKVTEWNERLEEPEASRRDDKRLPPSSLQCPVLSCGTVFHGPDCWDDRMEYVGKYLEEVVVAGSEIRQENDQLLIQWALWEGIIEGKPGENSYRLTCGLGVEVQTRVDDEDAEREDDLNENLFNHYNGGLGSVICDENIAVNTEIRAQNSSVEESREKGKFEQSGTMAIDDRNTDSCYHTEIGVEKASVGSCNSGEHLPGLSSSLLYGLIKNFTNILLKSPYVTDWAGTAATMLGSFAMETKVAGLLKTFAAELLPLASVAQGSRQKAEACIFIHRNRNRIARCFRESVSGTTTANVLDPLKSSNIQISHEEELNNMNLASNIVNEDVDEDSGGDENELPIEFSAVNEFMVSSPPFERLLEQFKASYCDRNEKLSMIRNLMTIHLAFPPKGLDHVAIFEMDWDLPKFMETQYNLDDGVRLASVITISGSGLCSQAVTSCEYLSQNWSSLGYEMLEALQAALDSPELAAKGMLTILFLNSCGCS